MEFDDAYRRTASLFGNRPEQTLVEFAPRLTQSACVLDVGCGQGRNTLFLARQGIEVDALDPSREAIDQVLARARAETLPVRGIVGTLASVAERQRAYHGVLIYGLFPLLRPDEIPEAVCQSVKLLAPGGLLWVSAFTTEDPAYETWKKHAQTRDGHSFQLESGRLRTFLAPGKMVELYEEQGLEALHHWEGLGPEHRHGDSPPERHGMVEAVFFKRTAVHPGHACTP